MAQTADSVRPCLLYFPVFSAGTLRRVHLHPWLSVKPMSVLIWTCLDESCYRRMTDIFYVILTHASIHVCKCHLFHVTLLMQSHKRSVRTHNSYSPAFIITPPPLSLINSGHDPFAQRSMNPLPKGVVPFCPKGSYPFAQRGMNLLPKGVVPFCPKGCNPFA